ncbi:hypothetical protein BDV29DRAFT_192350 [Aspergillus leporis]|uniref:Uncharacterized protein n=1 Tax=Aspergillus leporis TaxID=41062 RepID=A0A5N5WVU2_9EURO|nr:hypothetical protein BDV29DRAFT_192350 [Aspergillus leporis]
MRNIDRLADMPQICLEVSRKNDALVLAASTVKGVGTNIVQRWFTGKEAAYPSRMPLERHEEELLQFLDRRCEGNIVPVFEGHQGNWRPDLLLPANEADRFQVCEINAQFPSNGIDLTARIYAEERTGMRPRVVDPNDLRLFASLSPEIQQHLALSSVQDFRSTLLIHDKCILGILHQDWIPSQADLLRKRVIHTIIPGSNELRQFKDM